MTFEWPYLLASLLIVPLLGLLYLLVQRRRRAYALRFANYALLGQVVTRGPGLRRHVPPLLFILGLAVLLVALARPAAVLAVPREQNAVMLVLDVSGSMAAQDLQPDRLEAAKEAAEMLIAALPTDVRLGIVTFSSTANVVAPLTRDRAATLRALANLRPGGGTAIGEGLHAALEQLARRPANADGKLPPAFVVLLSDGQSTLGRPPATATGRAAQEQIPVYTVGVGERGASPIVGGRTPVGLDEATLQQIAEGTGGRYFYAAETAELDAIYRDLGSHVGWVEERTEITALVSAAGTLITLMGGLLSLRWFQQLP